MSALVKEWNKLDGDHKKFILRVRDSNGAKHGAEPESMENISLWTLAEESGFIKCVGSYKWISTEKFFELEREIFGI